MVTGFTGQLKTIVGIRNIARINQIAKAVEVISAIEEKGATFREEQAECVIDIELRAVRFYLGKIRIEGRIEVHVLRDTPAHIEACFRIQITTFPVTYRRVAGFDSGRCQCRNNFQVAAGFKIGQPFGFTELTDGTGNIPVTRIAANRRPLS